MQLVDPPSPPPAKGKQPNTEALCQTPPPTHHRSPAPYPCWRSCAPPPLLKAGSGTDVIEVDTDEPTVGLSTAIPSLRRLCVPTPLSGLLTRKTGEIPGPSPFLAHRGLLWHFVPGVVRTNGYGWYPPRPCGGWVTCGCVEAPLGLVERRLLQLVGRGRGAGVRTGFCVLHLVGNRRDTGLIHK